jgi:tellurium resistance protein TerD
LALAVQTSYLRLYDLARGAEMARYDLDQDFRVETAVELGRLYRPDGLWEFAVVGREELAKKYQR